MGHRKETDLGVGTELHCPLSGHRVTGVEHSACGDSAEHGQVLQGHLRWTVLTCRTHTDIRKGFSVGILSKRFQQIS